MPYAKVGIQIKQIRKNRGYSQERLSELSGISAVYIGYIEQGRRKPPLTTLQKIANVLGVRVKDLIPF